MAKLVSKKTTTTVNTPITRRSFGSVFFTFRGWKKEREYDIVIKS